MMALPGCEFRQMWWGRGWEAVSRRMGESERQAQVSHLKAVAEDTESDNVPWSPDRGRDHDANLGQLKKCKRQVRKVPPQGKV